MSDILRCAWRESLCFEPPRCLCNGSPYCSRHAHELEREGHSYCRVQQDGAFDREARRHALRERFARERDRLVAALLADYRAGIFESDIPLPANFGFEAAHQLLNTAVARLPERPRDGRLWEDGRDRLHVIVEW